MFSKGLLYSYEKSMCTKITKITKINKIFPHTVQTYETIVGMNNV